jgi:hypothetical protein
MNVMLLVAVVALVSVLGTMWWTIRDQPSWQTSVRGVAGVSFVLLSLGVWLMSAFTAGFACEPCETDSPPPVHAWTQDSEASEWRLILLLGSAILVLALVAVAALRLRRHRAALVLLIAYLAVALELGRMFSLVHGREAWAWVLWPTVTGAVMLLAARDRDGLPAVPGVSPG